MTYHCPAYSKHVLISRRLTYVRVLHQATHDLTTNREITNIPSDLGAVHLGTTLLGYLPQTTHCLKYNTIPGSPAN